MYGAQHSWRLFAPDESFFVATELIRITRATEPEEIDQWFEGGYSVFSGRGTPPAHPCIQAEWCSNCTDAGCSVCCFSGIVYRWIENSEEVMQETIRDLQRIIQSLDGSLLEHDGRG